MIEAAGHCRSLSTELWFRDILKSSPAELYQKRRSLQKLRFGDNAIGRFQNRWDRGAWAGARTLQLPPENPYEAGGLLFEAFHLRASREKCDRAAIRQGGAESCPRCWFPFPGLETFPID